MITIDYKKLNIRSGDYILDIGCGSGRHICGACQYPEVTVAGADTDMKELCAAVEKIRVLEKFGIPCSGRWGIYAASILELPFAEQVFDHVICSELMEHMQNETRAAKEMFRVLKPGGSLTVSVPRYFPERICWALSGSYANQEGGHVRIYTQKRIAALFENLGFCLKNRQWAHSLHTPYWWIKCLAGPENEGVRTVKLYHRFLVWDLMNKPRLTRFTERLFNPLLGKSLVLYFRKNA